MSDTAKIKDSAPSTVPLPPEAEFPYETSRTSDTGSAEPKSFAESSTAKGPAPPETLEGPIVPLIPSTIPESFKGVSIAGWRIRRIAAARQLLAIWKDAEFDHRTPSFAVHVNRFADKVSNYMEYFRGVPNEDMFCGILQVIRDAVVGKNFCVLSKEGDPQVISRILSSAEGQDLSLSTFDDAVGLLQEAGLGVWQD